MKHATSTAGATRNWSENAHLRSGASRSQLLAFCFGKIPRASTSGLLCHSTSAIFFCSTSFQIVYPGIDASVTTRKYGRLCGPSTVQFRIVGLNEVKVNLIRSSGGRGYVVLRYGRAPTMDGGGPEFEFQLLLLELTFPAVQ